MSPVGTMASDSTVHGVHHQHRNREWDQGEEEQEQELYDTNSFPFASKSLREIPPSEDDGPHYTYVMGDDEETGVYGSERYEGYEQQIDAYTSTPPRVAARRCTNSQHHRPTLDTRSSAELVEHQGQQTCNDMNVSPRNSTVVNHYSSPAGNPPQNRLPHQNPPQNRPYSAFRASLVIPSDGLSSSHRVIPQEAVVERSDYPRGAFERSSMPNIGMNNTPCRSLEQHRASAPNGSPVLASPRLGSPRQSARQPPVPNNVHVAQGFKQYEEYERNIDRLSPVPPYQSPRNSAAFQADHWARSRRYQQDRHDSDITLQGDYEDKRKYYLRDSGEKEKYSPRPDKDRRDRRGRSMSNDSRMDMQRRTTREVEDDADSYHIKGGVFSQLLRLTGRSTTLRRRVSSQRSNVPGDLPTMRSLGIRRTESAVSTAFGADELDPDDPRVTGQKKKARRSSFSDLPFTRSVSTDGISRKKRRRASIQYHVAGETKIQLALSVLYL